MPSPNRYELGILTLALVAVAVLEWIRAAPPAGEPVLVYIANETRPGERGRRNYERILEWLRSSSHEPVIAAADSIEKDRTDYPAGVDGEVRVIEASGFPAVIATNESTREGYVGCRRQPGGALERHELGTPLSTGNYILDESPLATKAALRSVLSTACRLFDPRKHTFFVVLKSHGKDPFVAIPRLCLRHEQLDRERVLRIAAGEDTADDQLVGVTRDELSELFRELDQEHSMSVGLLVLEVCGTAVKPSDVPPNVELVIGADGEVGYQNFDYAELLARPSLSDAFQRQAARRNAFFAIRGRRPGGAPVWLWIPLAIALIVAFRVWNRHRRSRAGGGVELDVHAVD